jgi:phenylacetate-CoA ligase
MLPALPTDRESLAAQQGIRLATLLQAIHGRNRFYTRKLGDAGIDVKALKFPRDMGGLPLTCKTELVADQDANPPWGTAHTESIDRYTRYCQTSSTTGRPLKWLDTNESWQWMVECWKAVYRAAHVGRGDRIFFPFSFGPFLGFWVGFEAACQLGHLAVPGGGMSSQLRLSMIDAVGATVICCTPTYALRLAEVAAEDRQGRPLAENSVRVIIVAGEPGGSIPATRRHIEERWGARVIDHHGLTEVGPLSFECWEAPGFLHLNEAEFICEILEPGGTASVEDGQPGELVVTNLGRTASPIVRYRTGDIVVRTEKRCACGLPWARLEGGILARADDMINVRGVNVYPTSIESVVRQFAEIAEFRSIVSRVHEMRSLMVEVELTPHAGAEAPVLAQVAQRLKEALGLNVQVRAVGAGSLPRFEMKARRFVVEG